MTESDLQTIGEHFNISDNQARRDLNDRRALMTETRLVAIDSRVKNIESLVEKIATNHLVHLADDIKELRELLTKDKV